MYSGRLMILVLLILGFGLVACDRAHNDTSSKMAIHLPSKMQSNKVGSLALTSTDQLAHVAINVSGGDMPAPVVLQWDSKGGDTTAATGPSSFTLEIPMGSDRLIQVLAVYQNTNTHAMTFYYGDGTKTLSATEETVTIPISQLGQSLDVLTGQVAGRILTAANEGPTGMVDVRFNPGGGKPSLIVDRTHIISGWLSVFMLSGVSLEYILSSTGANLFGGAVSLDSPQFAPSQQVLKMAIPVHIGEEYSGMTKVKTAQDAEINVWGYWSFNGTDISTKAICNGMAANVFSTLKVYNATPANAATALGYVALGTNEAYPTNAALLSTATVIPHVSAKGGALSSAAPCSSFNLTTDPFNNSMSVNKKSIDGYGHDQMAGFRNIYRMSSSANGGSAITIVPSGASAAVSGQVLPGVNALFDSIKFFKRSGVSGQNFYIEKPLCPEIATGALGFAASGEVSTIASDGTFAGSIAITSADFTGGNVAIVACPSKNGILGPLGYFTNMSSGGAGVSQPATKLAILDLNPTPPASLCTRFLAVAQDSASNPGLISPNTMVSFSTTNGSVYKDPLCANVASGSFSFNGYQAFFFKPTSPSGASVNFQYVSGNSSALTSSGAQSMSAVNASAATSLGFLAPYENARPLTCLPFHLVGKVGAAGSGNDGDLFPLTGISISSSGSASPTLYSDSICGKVATTITNSGNRSLVPMYIRALNSGVVNITATASLSGSIAGYPVDASLAGAPAQARIITKALSSNLGECVPVIAEVTDAQFWPSPMTAQTVTLTMGAGCTGTPLAGFYTDSACSAGPTTTQAAAISAGESRAILWMKSTAAGPGSCSISATISPSTITITPIPTYTFN